MCDFIQIALRATLELGTWRLSDNFVQSFHICVMELPTCLHFHRARDFYSMVLKRNSAYEMHHFVTYLMLNAHHFLCYWL